MFFFCRFNECMHIDPNIVQKNMKCDIAKYTIMEYEYRMSPILEMECLRYHLTVLIFHFMQ